MQVMQDLFETTPLTTPLSWDQQLMVAAEQEAQAGASGSVG
jgi:hypothetical protein